MAAPSSTARGAVAARAAAAAGAAGRRRRRRRRSPLWASASTWTLDAALRAEPLVPVIAADGGRLAFVKAAEAALVPRELLRWVPAPLRPLARRPPAARRRRPRRRRRFAAVASAAPAADGRLGCRGAEHGALGDRQGGGGGGRRRGGACRVAGGAADGCVAGGARRLAAAPAGGGGAGRAAGGGKGRAGAPPPPLLLASDGHLKPATKLLWADPKAKALAAMPRELLRALHASAARESGGLMLHPAVHALLLDSDDANGADAAALRKASTLVEVLRREAAADNRSLPERASTRASSRPRRGGRARRRGGGRRAHASPEGEEAARALLACAHRRRRALAARPLRRRRAYANESLEELQRGATNFVSDATSTPPHRRASESRGVTSSRRRRVRWAVVRGERVAGGREPTAEGDGTAAVVQGCGAAVRPRHAGPQAAHRRQRCLHAGVGEAAPRRPRRRRLRRQRPRRRLLRARRARGDRC